MFLVFVRPNSPRTDLKFALFGLLITEIPKNWPNTNLFGRYLMNCDRNPICSADYRPARQHGRGDQVCSVADRAFFGQCTAASGFCSAKSLFVRSLIRFVRPNTLFLGHQLGDARTSARHHRCLLGQPRRLLGNILIYSAKMMFGQDLYGQEPCSAEDPSVLFFLPKTRPNLILSDPI